MSTQAKHKYIGLVLCALVVLVMILVISKMELNLGNLEFSMGPSEARGIPTGEPAPDFTLKNLDGKTVRLTDYRGKVVLIDFWATWCPPCLKELPHIQTIHEKYREQGLVVLAISTDREKSAVPPFLEKNGYTFPVLFDNGKVQPAYKVESIPVVYLVDREGMIQWHHVGYGPGGEKELEQEVKKLFESGTDVSG